MCQGGKPWSSAGVRRDPKECKIKKSGDERLLSATTASEPPLSNIMETAPSKEAFNTSTDNLMLSFLVYLAVLLDFRLCREANRQATVAMASFDDFREARQSVRALWGTELWAATQK